MVRTGPRSRQSEIEKAILDLFLSSDARAHGLGFREHACMQGWPDEGVRHIETLEGPWLEKQHKASENAKGTSRIGKEPMHFEKLVIQRLNANRIAS